jgi:hypothetical protein
MKSSAGSLAAAATLIGAEAAGVAEAVGMVVPTARGSLGDGTPSETTRGVLEQPTTDEPARKMAAA